MPASIAELSADWRRAQDAVAPLAKLFVVGCAKSGTTWVQNLLDGHPEIVIKGEGCFAYQLVPLLSQAFARFNAHQQQMPAYTRLRDVELLLTARAIIDGQFARYIAAADCDAARLRVVGDKTPQHTIGMAALAQIYPEARFIHIIRDPRDAATSAWYHFGRREQRSRDEYVRYFLTKVWPLNVTAARQAGARLGTRYLELRYEDLHADEHHHVRRMLEFLSVDASEAAIQTCMAAGSFRGRSGGRERGQVDNNHFYRSGRVGDWCNHLPRELVDSCCAEIAPLMSACGYDSACAPATP